MPQPDPYRDLFECSADAILIIEGETFVDCNQATVDMLRYEKKEEVLATHPSELSPPTQPDGRDSFDKANEMIAIAFDKGSHRFEWDHKRADGEVFPVEVLLTAVDEGEKQILHVVWRDITERKHLEKQLRQAQRLEAIGQLAGGIAHDFNNLLVVILGHSDLLEMALEHQPDPLKHVREIRESGERATRLVRQLLAFSRKQEFHYDVIDLNQAVDSVDGLLRRLIGEDIRLETHRSDSPVRVKADRGQLEQVLLNLATNARDAMPGGGNLTIRVGQTSVSDGAVDEVAELDPGQYALITVSDNGVGMDRKTAQQAFDPFFTTKTVGKGTGLGLATVYGIVRRCGGAVTIDSSIGDGTSLKVYFPITTEPSAEPQKAPQRHTAEGNESILLVEDEPAVASLVLVVLQTQGYEVVLANDGREALEQWRERDGAFDLVLSDVVMPNLGGPGLVDQLQQEGWQPNVLFMSGYTDSALSRLRHLGNEVDLLKKPFTPTELIARVRQALDKRQPVSS